MILIAGAPCSGKTTLIKSQDRPTGTGTLLWEHSLNANTLRTEPSTTVTANTAVHYDHLRPFKRGQSGYQAADDPFLAQLTVQNEIHIITTLAPMAILSQRLQDRIQRLQQNGLSAERLAKLERLQQLYQDPALYQAWLQQWREFCECLTPRSHHLYLNSDHQSAWHLSPLLNDEILASFLQGGFNSLQ